jgi:hypothetical protein
MSNPLCQNVAQRKVHYDIRDRQSTGTRFQPRQPMSGLPHGATRGAHRPRRLVVRPNARHRGKRDGLAGRRRAASGTNLDPRREPRSGGVIIIFDLRYTIYAICGDRGMMRKSQIVHRKWSNSSLPRTAGLRVPSRRHERAGYFPTTPE